MKAIHEETVETVESSPEPPKFEPELGLTLPEPTATSTDLLGDASDIKGAVCRGRGASRLSLVT